MVRKFDFLVIGSGIAGMSFALKVAHKGKVALICKAGWKKPIRTSHKEEWRPSPTCWWIISTNTLKTR